MRLAGEGARADRRIPSVKQNYSHALVWRAHDEAARDEVNVTPGAAQAAAAAAPLVRSLPPPARRQCVYALKVEQHLQMRLSCKCDSAARAGRRLAAAAHLLAAVAVRGRQLRALGIVEREVVVVVDGNYRHGGSEPRVCGA
jgi:hypothetical protein